MRRCLPPVAWAVLLFVMLGLSSPIAAEELPRNLQLAGNCVRIENCSYKHGSSLSSLAGSGMLKVTAQISGQTMNYFIGNIGFIGISSDASGVVKTAEIDFPGAVLDDFLGTGINIKSLQGKLTVKQASGQQTAEFILVPAVETPFCSSNGKPLKLNFTHGDAKLVVTSNGDFDFQSREGGPVKDSTSDGSFMAAGMKITPLMAAINVSASRTQPAAFSMKCASGYVFTNIPQLLTVDSGELKLAFNDLKVNGSGEVTVKDMQLAGGEAVEIALSNPLDFIVRVKSARVSVENSAPTLFNLVADLALPQCLQSESGGRVIIPGLGLNLLKPVVIGDSGNGIRVAAANNVHTGNQPAVGSVTNHSTTSTYSPAGNSGNSHSMQSGLGLETSAASLAKKLAFNFNGYRVEASGLVIDLSREGPDDVASKTPGISSRAWQGIYIGKADVSLPTDDWKTTNNQPVTIPTTNCYIDTNGFSGTLQASSSVLGTAKVCGFAPKLEKLNLVISHNSVISSDCKGHVQVGELGTINLAINISDTGTNAVVEKGQAPLERKELGMMISVLDGSVRTGPNGQSAIWLNGVISLKVPGYSSLEKSVLTFHDLGVDSTGNFVFIDNGWLPLDNPANVDFGVFRCNLSSIGFVEDKGKWKVNMNGELALNSDLPVTGTLKFSNLRVEEGPKVAIDSIEVEAEIKNVVRIGATLAEGNQQGGGRFLKGSAELDLLFGGESTPLGGGFELYIGSDGCWAVAGRANIPNGMMPVGSTGLCIVGFAGGVAHNMDIKGGKKDYASVDELQANPNSDKWLFMAGTSMTTYGDDALFYCDGRLTVGLPEFFFNVHGDAWFLTKDHSKPAPLQVDVLLEPSVPLFRVAAGVDMPLLSRSLKILEITGGMQFEASKNGVSLGIGWPYPENALATNCLGGLISARGGMYSTIGSVAARAGAGFDYAIFSGSIDASMACDLGAQCISAAIWASGEVDFFIASVGASAALQAALYQNYMDFSGEFCAKINMPWPVPDFKGCVGYSGRYP